MEKAYWPPSHCEALKEYVTKGMSYADAARALNTRFGTTYSRSSALGRARRMRLGEAERPDADSLLNEAQSPRLRERRTADGFRPREFFRHPPPMPKRHEPVLRCVEVDPRHLAFDELEAGDCRFPYGGDLDGEPIRFCGHPRRKGSSYCTPHFHLTRNPDVATAPAAGDASLKLVRVI